MGGGRTRVPRVPQPLLPTPSSSPFISYSSTPPPCPPRAPLDTPISPPLIHPLRIAPLTHSLRIGTGHIFGQPWDPAGVHFFGRGYNKDGTQALRGAGYLSEPSAVELANAIASSAPMRRPDITDPAHWTPRATLRPAHVSPHLDHDLREGWGGGGNLSSLRLNLSTGRTPVPTFTFHGPRDKLSLSSMPSGTEVPVLMLEGLFGCWGPCAWRARSGRFE